MKTISIFILAFISALSLSASTTYSIYYLSIGSSSYEQNSARFKEKGFIPFDDLPEANTSALIIEELFKKYGSAKGFTLLATDRKLLTKKAIMAAIDSISKIIVRDKVKNPLLVIYYCGHGISENLAWNQYLIPGDYTQLPGNKSIEILNKQLISLGDLTDKLEKCKYPYVILADCCRKETADNSFPEKRLQYFFDRQNLETLKTVVSALKYLNEFHQSNPVIFSIVPGRVAPTVELPKNDIAGNLKTDTASEVGPLCRRLLLVLNKSFSTHSSISLGELVKSLIDPTLDKHSPVSVSFFESEGKEAELPFLSNR